MLVFGGLAGELDFQIGPSGGGQCFRRFPAQFSLGGLSNHSAIILGNPAMRGFLVVRCGGLCVLRFMKGHAGRAEHIVAHLKFSAWEITQFAAAIRALLAGSSIAGDAVSVSQILNLNDFAAQSELPLGNGFRTCYDARVPAWDRFSAAFAIKQILLFLPIANTWDS